MMSSSLEKALEETWKNKEKFYEETKNMSIMEIIEKIEGRKFNIKKHSSGIYSGAKTGKKIAVKKPSRRSTASGAKISAGKKQSTALAVN
ncbi:MAG: hypothetical protein LBI04_09940 [Treponema sp.]|jgi:hypothetical protein|nr:hypothetical protein [Treponema sp.]